MRMQLLDGFRGHLIIGMLVLHIASVHADASWIVYIHHKTFIRLSDAEFLVPIAGFVIGYMFRKKWAFQQSELHNMLIQRILKIYKYQIISAIIVVVPALMIAIETHEGARLISGIVDVVMINDGLRFTDILILYIELFAILYVTSKFLTTNRYSVYILINLGLYVIGSSFDINRAIEANFNILSLSSFNPFTWNFLFSMAILLGIKWDEILLYMDNMASNKRIFLLVLSVALYGLLSFARINVEFIEFLPSVIHNDLNVMMFNDDLDRIRPVRKHLHLIYVFQIAVFSFGLALVMTGKETIRLITQAKNILMWYFMLPFLRKIGAQSLKMYTFHVFVAAGYGAAANAVDGTEHDKILIPLLALFFMSLFFLFAYRDKFIDEFTNQLKSPAKPVQ